MIVFISILVTICILGTALDYFGEDNFKSSNLGKIFLCFSILANVKILLMRKNQEKNLGESDYLEIFSGIRSMSMGWIIMYHVFYFYSFTPALSNTSSIIDYVSDKDNLLANIGNYAVDAFFWLSAFLLAYFLIIGLDKNPDFTTRK